MVTTTILVLSAPSAPLALPCHAFRPSAAVALICAHCGWLADDHDEAIEILESLGEA